MLIFPECWVSTLHEIMIKQGFVILKYLMEQTLALDPVQENL